MFDIFDRRYTDRVGSECSSTWKHPNFFFAAEPRRLHGGSPAKRSGFMEEIDYPEVSELINSTQAIKIGEFFIQFNYSDSGIS